MAVNNQFITTSLVANTALAEFAVAAPWLNTASRMYEKDFTSSGYQVGDTIQVRRQNNFIVGDGSVATPQAIINTVENLTIAHQYHTMIEYTIKDLTLSIGDFTQQFIQPAIQNIIGQMELDIGVAAANTLYLFTGSSSTSINSYSAVDLAGTKLLEQGVQLQKDSYLAMSLRDASALKAALLSNFTPMFNEDIVRYSAIGHLSYFDLFQSQNINVHTAGAGPRLHPGDTLLVNGAVSSGSSIVMDGASFTVTDYFVVGDVFSITGVNSVNPITRQSTGQAMQFVVTANAASDGGGNITVSVSPSIVSSTASPLQNVSVAVPNNAVVNMVSSHRVNTAYISRALDIVCPPLYKLQVPYCEVARDKETGLSLTVTQMGDVQTYQNQMRIDVLCGFAWHPQYAARVCSTV